MVAEHPVIMKSRISFSCSFSCHPVSSRSGIKYIYLWVVTYRPHDKNCFLQSKVLR